MINSIKQAIVDKLVELYPASNGYTIYDEDIPQNFKTPSFLIVLIEQDYNKRLDTKYKSLISLDVAYYSDKDTTEIKSDCQEVQLTLFRAFDLIATYRVLDKKANTTDNILHFIFDIKCSEIKVETNIKMQQQQTNTNM